jgi:lipopolysaccharide transport system ATP-binding protein
MIAIKAENISKQYRLGRVGSGTLSHDLNRWWHAARGKEDPYLKIGESNDRSSKGESDYVWSLKNINFEVQQGEVLGIIGRNGAGKSTLLKLLSQITQPTTGNFKIKGRIASLLEVGTGFHPEMTGRENIFLNGSILGMTKTEIKNKFDEIVNFSGIERYVDTPVKRYSSGMYVRLAFAVAAHLESEILILDEVLAVGDAEFQKKCLGKMKDVSTQGRTVLFVSHNMLAVKSLCSSGLWLDKGEIIKTGDIQTVTDAYESRNSQNVSSEVLIEKTVKGFTVHSISVSNNGVDGNFDIDEDLILEISVSSAIYFDKININLFFNTGEGGALIFVTCSEAVKFNIGSSIYTCTIPAGTLNDSIYNLDLMIVENAREPILNLQGIISLEGVEEKREGGWLAKFPGLIRPKNLVWIKK